MCEQVAVLLASANGSHSIFSLPIPVLGEEAVRLAGCCRTLTQCPQTSITEVWKLALPCDTILPVYEALNAVWQQQGGKLAQQNTPLPG